MLWAIVTGCIRSALFLPSLGAVKYTTLYILLTAILICGSHSVAAERTDFRVNNDIGTTRQDHPRVAVEADASFVVVWVDYRGPSSDIFAQKYNSEGYPVGENMRLNDDLSDAYQFEPAVAVDLSGRHCHDL